MNLVFDMDGTLVNFYGVKNWLTYLKKESTVPYDDAAPLFDMAQLKELLLKAKSKGHKIVVTSWLCGAIDGKAPSKEYNKAVRKSKKEWLKKYDFPYDEIHLVKYGTTKANCTRKDEKSQILFDDNEKIRKGWKLGKAYSEKEILKVLTELTK